MYCFKKKANKVKLTAKSIRNRFANDENGNVLLFTIVCLLFLVFVSSMTSIAIANRVSFVRKTSDNNQFVSIVDHKNASIENAIVEILNQNDELARYYVSNHFYRNLTNSYVGSNNDLDAYLNDLFEPGFQTDFANKYNSMLMQERVDVAYAYLCIRRLDPGKGLQSYTEKISTIGNASITSSTHTLGSVSIDSIKKNIIDKNNFELVKLDIKSEVTPSVIDNVSKITTTSSYSINAYKYQLSGNDIVHPSATDFIEKTLSTKKSIISPQR